MLSINLVTFVEKLFMNWLNYNCFIIALKQNSIVLFSIENGRFMLQGTQYGFPFHTLATGSSGIDHGMVYQPILDLPTCVCRN